MTDSATAALLRTAADWLEDPDPDDLVLRDLVMHIAREARRFTEDLRPAVEADPSADVEALAAAWVAERNEAAS